MLADRARWYRDQEQYEKSLDDWTRAIELEPDRLVLYQQRCDTYLHNRQADQVLADWDTMMQLYKSRGFPGAMPTEERLHIYNNRAYHYGVANVRIPDAMADANQAIQLLGGNVAMIDRHGFSQFLQAYNLYLEKQFPTALIRCNLASTWAEKAWRRWEQAPGPGWKPGSQQLYRQRVQEFKQYQAHILLLRSLVHEAMDRPKFHNQDLEQIRALGFQSSELTLPLADHDTPRRAVVELQRILNSSNLNLDARAMILDTRGFLYWRQDRPRPALWDLELAVEFSTSQHRILQEALQRQTKIAVDVRPLEQELALVNKNLAVILYHRSLAYQALQQPLKARQDHELIRKLGYQISEHLF